MKLKLKELRQSRGLTQQQLGEALSIKQNQISKYESGFLEPNLETLTIFSKFFNVSTDYLLGLEDEFGNKIDNDGDMYVKVVARSKGNTVKPHYEKLTPEDIKLFEEIIAKLKKE